jgi:hypothetical protein
MNATCQTQLANSAKHALTDRKNTAQSWRSLRESNPSFQIENLTSLDTHARVYPRKAA